MRTLSSVGACKRTGLFIIYMLTPLGQKIGSKKKVTAIDIGAWGAHAYSAIGLLMGRTHEPTPSTRLAKYVRFLCLCRIV
jgi:hypothetical protein